MQLKFIGKTIHRFGVFIAGIWIGSLTINHVFPKHNDIEKNNLERQTDLGSIGIKK